jgi:hypothetical protein
MLYFRRASLLQTLWLFSVLGLIALRANSSPAPASPTPAALAVLTEADQTLMTPTEAFIRLQEGNNRFRAG